MCFAIALIWWRVFVWGQIRVVWRQKQLFRKYLNSLMLIRLFLRYLFISILTPLVLVAQLFLTSLLCLCMIIAMSNFLNKFLKWIKKRQRNNADVNSTIFCRNGFLLSIRRTISKRHLFSLYNYCFSVGLKGKK